MERYLTPSIADDLNKKMVFLGGPRQVGKTTISLQLLNAKNETHPGYLNWDLPEQKLSISKGHLPAHQPLIVFDEIHKYRLWRNLIKGLYDTNKSSRKFLITGSARLDYYNRGGESLQGRYHFLRLHPLSLGELKASASDNSIKDLLVLGGFPEPFLSGSKKDWRRWHNERIKRVIHEDILSLEKVNEISQLGLLLELLPSKIGSPLSLKSLAEDIQVSPHTIKRWLLIFDNLYQSFRISPYGSTKIRAVKKEQKLYLWDWSVCENDGAKFENLVASQLLKYCHFKEDTEGFKMELKYLRDTDSREVDFVVLKENKPLFAVEVKSSETALSPHVKYFAERTSIPYFYQVHLGTKDYEVSGLNARVIPFANFVKEIGMP